MREKLQYNGRNSWIKKINPKKTKKRKKVWQIAKIKISKMNPNILIIMKNLAELNSKVER